jgi:hypothetical protein
MPNAGAGISKKTYISSSMAACSCGGQLVQLPGSEVVNPATSRPASIFLASSMFICRVHPALPVLKLSPGSSFVSEKRTICREYRLATSQENSASVARSKFKSTTIGLGRCAQLSRGEELLGLVIQEISLGFRRGIGRWRRLHRLSSRCPESQLH